MALPFELDLPVIAAPMAGGPTTIAMITAAHRAGSIGFLPAGYKTAADLEREIVAMQDAGVRFGVNLFAPGATAIDPADFRHYATELQPEADVYGIELANASLVEDDDAWRDKLDVLLAHPVPVVSFTFALPSVPDIRELRRVGMLVAQTVTTADEAKDAEAAGVDLLVVQGFAAGGHSGTFHPDRPVASIALTDLVLAVRSATDLPVIAAGGIATPSAVVDTIAAGASAVAVGTALLLADEAGTSVTHRAALVDPARTGTMLTRAFTGRPARALVNGFASRHSESAPVGYPAIHHLTRPLRQAAGAAGDAERLHLWAGEQWRETTARPTADTLTALAGSL